MRQLNERRSIEEDVLVLVVIELESTFVFEGCRALLRLLRLGMDRLLLLGLLKGFSFSIPQVLQVVELIFVRF